jgi:hypothetical protein
MICLPNCVNNEGKPRVGYTNGCKPKRAKGGIPRLLFLICDPDHEHPVEVEEGVNPYTNLDNMKAAMCAGLLNFSGPILGQQPRTSPTKKQLQSCGPEEVVGGTQTITFQDYNIAVDEDGNANLEEYDFWIWVMENYQTLKFGWVTCDEMVYMYDGDWSPDVSPVTEQTNKDNRFFDGIMTMPTEQIIKPFQVPGILALLDSFSADTTCYS